MKNKLLANQKDYIANQLEWFNKKSFGSVKDPVFGETKELAKSKSLVFALLLACSSMSDLAAELVAKNPRFAILAVAAILVVVRLFATAKLVFK